MTLLNTRELNALRARFDKFPMGLQCVQFVGAMLDILKGESSLDEKQLTVRLCELFDQVDVNGNKLMEWDEFSGFCIETGMRLGRGDDLNKKFKEDILAPVSPGVGKRIARAILGHYRIGAARGFDRTAVSTVALALAPWMRVAITSFFIAIRVG